MTRDLFVQAAKINGWTRKQVRNELFKLGEPLWSERDEILAAIGFAPTAEPVAVVEQPAPKPVAPRLGKGQFALKYAAADVLTGAELSVGTIVTAVKLGGQWDFTAEPIDYGTFKKLREAMLFSLGDDEGGPDGVLDHEDYRLLCDYGTRYPHIVPMIGCHVAGLDN